MTPLDFKRQGHVRPSAYVRESHPQMGVKLYDHWIAPHDLEEFARWILGASEWCKVQLGNDVAQALPQDQEPISAPDTVPARSQKQRQKKG